MSSGSDCRSARQSLYPPVTAGMRLDVNFHSPGSHMHGPALVPLLEKAETCIDIVPVIMLLYE